MLNAPRCVPLAWPLPGRLHELQCHWAGLSQQIWEGVGSLKGPVDAAQDRLAMPAAAHAPASAFDTVWSQPAVPEVSKACSSRAKASPDWPLICPHKVSQFAAPAFVPVRYCSIDLQSRPSRVLMSWQVTVPAMSSHQRDLHSTLLSNAARCLCPPPNASRGPPRLPYQHQQ